MSRRETLQRAHVAAELFNNEADPAPIHTIARKFDISTRQAHRLIAVARKLGWITRTAPTGLVKNPLVHGTFHAYSKHRCRCSACKSANTSRALGLRHERYTRDVPDGIEHGNSVYSNWGCRCDICCKDHRSQMIKDQESRRARGESAPHGTPSGYRSWGCRCDACCRAASEYRREYRAGRRVTA